MHGLLAEFTTSDELLAAAKAAHGAGYRRLEAYSPFPIEGLADAVGMRESGVSLVTFAGGATGLFCAYFMQWFATVISYPVNVGGRPHYSWPSYIPISFELTILFAGLSAGLIGVLAMNGLPRPYHPLFNAPRFERASQDSFFLCIEASDARFARAATAEFLTALGADGVFEVDE